MSRQHSFFIQNLFTCKTVLSKKVKSLALTPILLRYGITGFCIYVVCMLYFGNTNKYFSYNEIDDNHDGFLSPGELLWYSDVGTQVKCNPSTNNSSRKCVLVIFALKDGLTIKEIPIDDNQTNIGKYDKLEDTPYQQGLSK